MLLCIDKETLSTAAEIFEIITPVTLLCWFFHSRWESGKHAYYKEFVGIYGGFVNETINKSNDTTRYDGGLMMEVFDVDDNGYFRGNLSIMKKRLS